MSRLHEERGEFDLAEVKYRSILKRHPSYPGCFLRLAACDEARGRLSEAIGWAQKELSLHPKQPEAWCALGNMYLCTGEYKRADSCFRSLLNIAGDERIKGEKVPCRRDPYAAGQLAWIQIKLAQAATPAPAPLTEVCASASGAERIDKATEMLRKILTTEPNHLYAANGLGLVCLAKGRLSEARSIFTQVAAPKCSNFFPGESQPRTAPPRQPPPVAPLPTLGARGERDV